MEQLQQLAHLKRQATTLDGLQRYVSALYERTNTWADPNVNIGTAALHYDALIDRIAKDAPEQPLERSHTPEHTTDDHLDHQTLTKVHSG